MVCVGLGLVFSGAARADVFTINPLQSMLTLSGVLAGSTATPQPPSGFLTSYSGTIDATVLANSVQFNGAQAVAANSGNYSPMAGGGAGTAPGNYGGMFTAGGFFPGTFALRGLMASLSSGAISLTGGSFDASQLMFSVLAGSADYRVAALAMMGTASLVGDTGQNGMGNGTISIVNGVQTLTIPIDVTIIFTAVNANDSMFRLQGLIVATAVPEPATYVLFGMGLLVCAQRFRRKGRR